MSLPSGKADFPGLLPIGRHSMGLDEVRMTCVDHFPLSKTRNMIMLGLIGVVERLRGAGIEGELWIDGSFLTEKIDPEDCDMVLRIPGLFFDACTPEQQTAVDWVTEGARKTTHHCDAYAFPAYPEGHPDYWVGEYMYAYWMKQWGFDRSENMKGIAVVELTSR